MFDSHLCLQEYIIDVGIHLKGKSLRTQLVGIDNSMYCRQILVSIFILSICSYRIKVSTLDFLSGNLGSSPSRSTSRFLSAICLTATEQSYDILWLTKCVQPKKSTYTPNVATQRVVIDNCSFLSAKYVVI